jgi:PAS domain S-box-containing protein
MSSKAADQALRAIRPMARHPQATAIGMAALILVLTVVIAIMVRRDHDARLSADAHARASFVAARLEAHVETHLSLAALVRQEWRDGLIENRASFAHQASSKLQQFSALQALSWVDPQGIIRWIAPISGNEGARNLNVRTLPGPAAALAQAERTGRLVLTQPITLAQGGIGFVGYLPVDETGAGSGFVNAVFRADRLFAQVLTRQLIKGYGIRVTDAGQRLYSDGGVVPEAPGYAQVGLSIRNRDWQIAMAPTPSHLAESETVLDELVLGFGLLAALLVAAMIYSALSAHSRLRDQRQRLADYVTVSSDWFWEMDADLRFSFFSDRFQEVTGVAPAALLGRTRAEVGAPGADPDAFARHLQRLADHLPFRDFVHTRERPDGETVYLAISGKPAFDETGRFIGYRGIGRDITRQKRDEVTLIQALQDAERASQAKSDFLATMSHEFRTPLNAIIGFSDLMGQEVFGPLGSERYRGYANDIQHSGQHMLAMVNDVLDLAKLESGKRPLALEPVAVDTFLSGCLRPFVEQAARKEIRLELTVPDTLPLLWADPRALTQVIFNLMSNAVKFTRPGGTVTLTAAVDDAAQTLALSVRDTGIGISETGLTRIREPFYQDKPHSHHTQEGSGLGLAIVHGLVEAHDGSFTVDSKLGKGTTVTVTLPLSGPAVDSPD